MNQEGDKYKSGCLTFDPGGPSTINWNILDQYLESNKSPRRELNKITN